jgi:UDP-glucose 4-epimerase
MSMRVLVTGGAGYIGSVAAHMMAGAGNQILVIDNLSKGHRRAVGDLDLEVLDIEDAAALRESCLRFKPEACLHFAARSLVGESRLEPESYFRTNVEGTANLLGALAAAGCRRLVFSSTAAVYGEPARIPILETDPRDPINPYGSTKLAVEKMLEEMSEAGDLRYASLRYFNAAGADVDAGLGEDHDPETHLIPRVIEAALGREPQAVIFGTDYPTPDGTCIRDYIHVKDLARAHVLALEHIDEEGGAFNLGNGQGFSVRQVIDAVKKVSGREFEVVERPRREGDPGILTASSERIASVLGWKAEHPGLENIIGSAWSWHSEHPQGYTD